MHIFCLAFNRFRWVSDLSPLVSSLTKAWNKLVVGKDLSLLTQWIICHHQSIKIVCLLSVTLTTFPSNPPNFSVSSKRKTEISKPFILLCKTSHWTLICTSMAVQSYHLGWLDICEYLHFDNPEYRSYLCRYKFIWSTYPTDQQLIQTPQTPKRITDKWNQFKLQWWLYLPRWLEYVYI